MSNASLEPWEVLSRRKKRSRARESATARGGGGEELKGDGGSGLQRVGLVVGSSEKLRLSRAQ